MQLTEKEKLLLKDLKGQEALCVQKYKEAATKANDKQLCNLFNKIATAEQKHYDAITEIEGGTAPTMRKSSAKLPTFTKTYNAETEEKKNDCFLCTDLLSAEKHASSLYDTCVFEFTTEQLRSVLNTIQSEEQAHGKMIYDYMSTNSMYS